MSNPKTTNTPPELKPFEVWATEKNIPDWQVAALAAHAKYPVGREVTELEFDTGLLEVLGSPLGGVANPEPTEPPSPAIPNPTSNPVTTALTNALAGKSDKPNGEVK